MKYFPLIILFLLCACSSDRKKLPDYLYKEGQCLNYKGHYMYIMAVEKPNNAYNLYGNLMNEDHWFSERRDYVHFQMFPTKCTAEFLDRFENFKQKNGL